MDSLADQAYKEEVILPARADECMRRLIPKLAEACSRERLMKTAEAIVHTDRRNSFDAFAETATFLTAEIENAGLQAERHRIPTGGGVGDGRWRINWCSDIVGATLTMISPRREPIADCRRNPWEAIQWSLSTPPEGLDLKLVTIDSQEELQARAPGSLRGCAVLTSAGLHQRQRDLVRLGAEAVICDSCVKNLPHATQWTKFGWGGLQTGHAGARIPGVAISADKGARLRRVLADAGSVTININVQTRDYHGTHDVISAILPGCQDPQNEVWALAHAYEPGAVDNASGVAACLEALRILQALAEAGDIEPPRRSIRALAGYECYGFFHVVETVKRLQLPLASIVVDCVGACADVCEGSIGWHATVPSSAGFVNDIGLGIARRCYALAAPEFAVKAEPFASTEDTMVGDPAYGSPCGYLGVYPYTGYHSSADTTDILDPDAFVAATLSTAAYLYYFASADSEDALELAGWQAETTHMPGQNTPLLKAATRRETRNRLSQFFWDGHHTDLRNRLEAALAAGADAEPKTEPNDTQRDRRVPFRRVPLAPTYENVPYHLKEEMQGTGVHKWALYWADGRRDLDEIRLLANAERNASYSREQIAAFFEGLAAIGYVKLCHADELVTYDQLCSDLQGLGVEPGMDLMVHSSLSSIGWVHGGADTVVDALLDVIGPQGTLMMPSFNHRAAAVYNPLTTPTTNGAIPDAFWRRAETVRSLHPTHAVAAQGPKAEAWCSRHIEVGIWSADSPIGKLIHEGGFILSLGVDHTTSTAYHVAEISMKAPCLDQFGGRRPVVMPDGTVQEVPALLWRDGVCPVRPDRLNDALDSIGVQKHGRVGQAESALVRAKALWEMRRKHLRHACPTCPIRPLPPP